MSGHSKWSQIKQKKGATDAAKSRTFSRFARLITIEAKKANGNLSSPGLVSAIERAKAANMPKDNIERAVSRGNSKDAGELESVAYEFYGPGGSAIIVSALTDNRNRTTQEVKHLLSKNGFELGTPGSALWAFAKTPDGTYAPNEPLMDVSGDDETKLAQILETLDEHEDVQAITTNARGYESTEE
ncbi:MAG TPA: YebC/PmpR family DNA-binding transcriptional regulator [Candidatus Paceibacterota bacterium]|jgi:YebC/PmpR family DNA-binding regulatory protein|nr:YebC/PmpR family DNA-binding transcriptional regulator [Candidatus Paceibacterota bacterium]